MNEQHASTGDQDTRMDRGSGLPRVWNRGWSRFLHAFLVPPQLQGRFTRFCWRTLFVGIGLALFVSGQPSTGHLTAPSPTTATAVAEVSTYPGMGAGNTSTGQTITSGSRIAYDGCDDSILKDPSCWVKTRITDVGKWVTQGFYDSIYPFAQMVFQSPVNIIFQTPKELTYANTTVIAFTQDMQKVAAAAFGVLFVLAVVATLLGRQMGLHTTEYSEALLRATLAFVASQVSLFVMQLFIDCNNALTLFVWSRASLEFLKRVVTNDVTLDFLSNWVYVVLSFMLLILMLLLLWNMFVRLVMLIFLMVMAPLGLLCFALPLTERWGSLWLRNVSTTVFVQFFQVVIVALGCALGMQFMNDANTPLWQLLIPSIIKQPLHLIGLVMAGICFYLALKFPGMLREWVFAGTATSATSASLAVGENVGERAGAAAKSVMSNAARMFL